MANCKSCGMPAGIFSTLCDSCKAGIVAQKLQLEQEEARRKKREEVAERTMRLQLEESQRQEAERLKQEIVNRILNNSVKSVSSGENVYLYETLFFPVDSMVVEDFVCNSFDIASLRRAGLQGWEIVGVVPKTAGIALTNVSVGSSTGSTWGAGLGGNVVGVYILLRLAVRQSHIADGLLESYIKDNLVSLTES